MRISSLFLFVFALSTANAKECEPVIVAEPVTAATSATNVKSWNLGGGFSFERNGDMYYLNTPAGPVGLPAGHYANFHNLTAIARQPDPSPGHPDGFIVIAVNDGHLSHLISLDAAKAEKYRHRLLDGKVTSITSLPNSMLLLKVDSPFDVWEADRGVRLELVDNNIHGVHAKVLIGKSASEPVVENSGGVTTVTVNYGLNNENDWMLVRQPNGKYRLDPY